MDAALLHAVIAGHDPRDSTSIPAPVPDVVGAARLGASGDLSGVRLGIVREFAGEGAEPGVVAAVREGIEALVKLGAEVVEVSCPHFEYALPAYYLIAPSECSSNLARFDGVRYGLRVGDDGQRSLEEVMSLTREAGFGPEVKRRIMIGTYALSSGYYDAYYGQAQKVRTLITPRLRGGVRAGRRAGVADDAVHRVPVGRAHVRPVPDVPGRPVHDPVQPVRRAGDLRAGRTVRGAAGRAAGDGADDGRRPDVPGGGGTGDGGAAAHAAGAVAGSI